MATRVDQRRLPATQGLEVSTRTHLCAAQGAKEAHEHCPLPSPRWAAHQSLLTSLTQARGGGEGLARSLQGRVSPARSPAGISDILPPCHRSWVPGGPQDGQGPGEDPWAQLLRARASQHLLSESLHL